MILRINANYEGINSTIEVKGKVINNIFEIKEPYVSAYEMIDYDLVEEFNEWMNLVEEEIFDYDPRASSSVVRVNLEEDGIINQQYIIENPNHSNTKHEHKFKHVLINIMATDENRPSWK